MANLPETWAWAPLSAITGDCEQQIPDHDQVFTYVDIGAIDRTTKTITFPQDLLGKDAPSRARKVIRAGDTLVSMTRPNLNAVALVSEALDGQIASTGFDVLRPEGVSPKWVSYLVQTRDFVDAMSGLVQGALYPAIRPRDIRNYLVPVAPAKEQERIVAKLDAMFARIEICRKRLDRVTSLLKRFRQMVLECATDGRLTADWRLYRDQPWRITRLEQVAADFTYGSSARSAKAGRVPVLRMGNIQDGQVSWDDLVYTSDENEITKYALAKGDLLFNRTNSPELVGKSAVYKGEREAIYAGYLIRVRCQPSLLPDYLSYCLGSPKGRAYCWQVKSDGVSQSNINAKKLAAFEFQLPPIEEQQEIIRRVELYFRIADRIEARHSVVQKQVDNLVPVLLAKAFRGELVQQDQSEESAQVLLDHIAAIRAAKPVLPRSRTTVAQKAQRAKREKSAMTKSRLDDDVKGKPYLANHLRQLGGNTHAETLYRAADLPVTDFYKQLVWEVEQGFVRSGKTKLELPDAA